MRTGQFIKMLQEVDPTGEGFIMMSDGGVPQWFEQKHGYYDGAYSFIDERGRMVKSTDENKVDVICKEKEWVIWDDLDWLVRQDMAVAVEKGVPYHFDEEYWFQRTKELFIFDSTVADEYKEKFFQTIRGDFESWRSYKVEADQEWMERTLKEYNEGIRFFEEKDKKEGYRKTFEVHVDGKQDGLCSGTIQALFYSGAFKRIEHNDKLWEWIPKEQ